MGWPFFQGWCNYNITFYYLPFGVDIAIGVISGVTIGILITFSYYLLLTIQCCHRCHRCIGCCQRWWWNTYNTYYNIYHYLLLKTNEFCDSKPDDSTATLPSTPGTLPGATLNTNFKFLKKIVILQ